jgi:hypothetical protein
MMDENGRRGYYTKSQMNQEMERERRREERGNEAGDLIVRGRGCV